MYPGLGLDGMPKDLGFRLANQNYHVSLIPQIVRCIYEVKQRLSDLHPTICNKIYRLGLYKNNTTINIA